MLVIFHVDTHTGIICIRKLFMSSFLIYLAWTGEYSFFSFRLFFRWTFQQQRDTKMMKMRKISAELTSRCIWAPSYSSFHDFNLLVLFTIRLEWSEWRISASASEILSQQLSPSRDFRRDSPLCSALSQKLLKQLSIESLACTVRGKVRKKLHREFVQFRITLIIFVDFSLLIFLLISVISIYNYNWLMHLKFTSNIKLHFSLVNFTISR